VLGVFEQGSGNLFRGEHVPSLHWAQMCVFSSFVIASLSVDLSFFCEKENIERYLVDQRLLAEVVDIVYKIELVAMPRGKRSAKSLIVLEPEFNPQLGRSVLDSNFERYNYLGIVEHFLIQI